MATDGDRRGGARPALIAGVVVVVLAVAAGLFWFLDDDAPEEVDLDAAAEGVRHGTDSTPADGPTDRPADVRAALQGSWTVDTDTGGFDFESATGSFVGFRVQEELVGIGAATAVGRTGEVRGSITIEEATLTDVTFEVDMTSITTNERRRDQRVQSALHTDVHPTASFRAVGPVELGDGAVSAGEVKVDVAGELTVNGVTRPFTIPIEARLVDGTIVVVGSADITFSDFDVQVPSAPVVLSAEDHGTLELQLLLVRG